MARQSRNQESFDYNSFKQQALRDLQNGKPLAGKEGILTPLLKNLFEASLQGELEAHLDSPEELSNCKNGYTPKTVKTQYGNVELQNPRDRNSTFQPQIIPKRKTVLNESLDDKILSLYALGMRYHDISQHMEELYGVELSKGTLSAITDKVIPLVREWQGRQLERFIPLYGWMRFSSKLKHTPKMRLLCPWSGL